MGRLLGSSLLARHLKAEQLSSIQERDHLDQLLDEVANACFEEREKLMTPEYMRTIERWQLMRSIDAYWMEHLAEMDYLRDSIWHEGYAQRDPVGIYKHEGFLLFQKTLGEIRAEVTEQVFNLQLQNNNLESNEVQMQGMQEARITAALPADEDGFDDGVDLYKDADGESPVRVTASPATTLQNGRASVGRNDPCPCGSGKKYKKCCLPKEQGTLV
jgi:preprotein translocase subunit SecA